MQECGARDRPYDQCGTFLSKRSKKTGETQMGTGDLWKYV